MAHQPKLWSLGLPISDPVFPKSLGLEPAAAQTFPFLWFPLPPFHMVLLTFLSTDHQSMIYRTPQSCPLEEISVSWITLEVWQNHWEITFLKIGEMHHFGQRRLLASEVVLFVQHQSVFVAVFLNNLNSSFFLPTQTGWDVPIPQ